MTTAPIPDDGAIIDDLVADIIATAGANMKIAEDAFRKLAEDPRLLARYGDFNLGLTFGSKVIRRDVHKALQAKGMSIRQIAATTGTPTTTVHADLRPKAKAVPNGTPAVLAAVPNGTPAEDEDEATLATGTPYTQDDLDADIAAINAALAPVAEVTAPVAVAPVERPELTALVKSVTKRNPLTDHELNRLRSLIPLRS